MIFLGNSSLGCVLALNASVKKAIRHTVVAEVFDKKIRAVTPEYLLLLKLLPLSDQDIVDVKALARKADMHRVTALARKHYLLPKLETALGKKHRKWPTSYFNHIFGRRSSFERQSTL